MKELKIMAIILVAFTLFGAIMIVINNTMIDHFDAADYKTVWHRVNKGETLWELGTDFKADGDDVRDWITAVKKLNRMNDSGLVAGDYIQIYVAK